MDDKKKLKISATPSKQSENKPNIKINKGKTFTPAKIIDDSYKNSTDIVSQAEAEKGVNQAIDFINEYAESGKSGKDIKADTKREYITSEVAAAKAAEIQKKKNRVPIILLVICIILFIGVGAIGFLMLTNNGGQQAQSQEQKQESYIDQENLDITYPPEGEVIEKATLSSPAKIGEWILITDMNENGQYSPVFFRLSSTDYDQYDVAVQVDSYNENPNGRALIDTTQLSYDDAEFGIANYEVYYPENYSTAGDGKIEIDALELSIVDYSDNPSLTFNEIKYDTMITYDISIFDQEVVPGSIFSGSFLYTHLKDFSDYLFKIKYFNIDTQQFDYIYIQGT